MKKILFLLAIAAGATASIPALRVRAEAVLGPPLDPYLDRVLNPIRANLSARRERMLLGRLKEVREGGTPLPRPSDFEKWVKAYVQDPNAYLDPWGRDYILNSHRDSLYVVSVGPDGKRGTADDIVSGIPTPRGD